jgi:eukaryotic-like serine/threonine-protein kinase
MAGVRVNPPKLSPADQHALAEWERRLEAQPDAAAVAGLVAELPPPGTPLRPHLLLRLVLAHMVRTSGQGAPPGIAGYLESYPELAGDADAVRELERLEHALCSQHNTPAAFLLGDEEATFQVAADENGDAIELYPEPAGEGECELQPIEETLRCPLPTPAELPVGGDPVTFEQAAPGPAAEAEGRQDPVDETVRRPLPTPADLPVGEEERTCVQGEEADSECESATRVGAQLPTIPDPLPEQFGRYRIRHKLAGGNMGTVYLADDTQLDRPVVLKVPTFGPDDTPDVLARFYREAKATAKLNHPNVCPVHDVGECGGVPFLTMAYVEGRTLAEALAAQGPFDPAHAAEIVRKLALGLEAAHRSEVVHRDLRPANIILTPQGEPVVMDFGLARRFDHRETLRTEPSTLVGTVAYLAPEQIGGEAEPASDVYGLGVILYELLTGHLPFQGDAGLVVVQKLANELLPPSVYRPDLDPRLEAVCLKALAHQAADRYPSMAAFAADLEHWLRHPPSCLPPPEEPKPAPQPQPAPARERPKSWMDTPPRPRRRWGWVAWAAGALLPAAGLLGLLMMLSQRPTPATEDTPETPPPRAVGEERPPLLQGVKVEGVHTLTGHQDWVTSVAFVAGNEVGLSAGHDGTLRLWDLTAGRERVHLPAHDGTVWGVAVSKDGKRVLSGGSDGLLKLWDLETHTKLLEWRGHRGWVLCVALSPDGKQALSGGDDGALVLWDATTGEQRQALAGHTGPVQSVAFAPDGQHALSGGTDGTVLWWDLRSGAKRRLDGHRGIVWGVAVAPDGRRALSAGADGTLRLWDLANARPLGLLTGHRGDVHCVAVSPDGRLAFSGGADRTVRVWDLEYRREVAHAEGHTDRVQAIAVSPDGSLALSGSADQSVRLWRIKR